MANIFEIIADFKWKAAPFNDIYLVMLSSSLYIGFVLLYAFTPSVRNIFKLSNTRPLVNIHNVVLCVGSLIMCVGTGYEVIKRSILERSVLWLVCESPSTEANGALWFWSYVYYLSKYYELIDTILQFLSNKTPPNFFLHVYHHSLVIFMSWAWIDTQASSQFVGIFMNTLVHVVMYYYFYLKSIGINPWWKSYVTSFQIVQFIFSLVIIFITFGYSYQRQGNADDSLYPQCKGLTTIIGSLIFNATLLKGFIDVLGKNAKPPTTKKGENKSE